jgi:hypothetical protein
MESADFKNWGLAITGALVGGVVGQFVFELLLGQGFYVLALPGAFVGWGASFSSRRRNVRVGVFSAVCALIVSIYSEWDAQPFVANESFSYFVTHLYQLKPFTLLMIVLGVVFGFSLGAGRDRI